jgi:hypothetical protein
MEAPKKIIKEDINFLEYPNWVIDRKSTATTWSIEKANGKYEVISPLGLPKHFDKIVLYFLLYKLYLENGFSTCVSNTSRYEVAKNVFCGVKDLGKNKFDRIMKALKKWSALTISFEGVFYADNDLAVRFFHIIDECVLNKKTGELIIKWNQSYVRQLEESRFYKLIDFEQYKKLTKTSSARLYEILVKSFKDRSEWAINMELLAEKLTFEKRPNAKSYYASDILRYLKPAITEINKKTDLYISFTFNKNNNACIFRKLKKTKEDIEFMPAVKEDKKKSDKRSEYLNEFNNLSLEQQEEIMNKISRHPFWQFLPDQESKIVAYMQQQEKEQN